MCRLAAGSPAGFFHTLLSRQPAAFLGASDVEKCQHCGRPASDFKPPRGFGLHKARCPRSPDRRPAASAETRAKISAAAKRSWACPEERDRRIAALKASQARPEVKARHSAAMKSSHARPEVREKIASSLRSIGANWHLDDRGGYVYYMVNPRTGAGKVGSAFDVEKRRGELAREGYLHFCQRGDPVEVALEIRCDCFRRVEARAQELLYMDDHHRHLYGEQCFASLDEIEEAILRARSEVDGGKIEEEHQVLWT